MEATLFTTESYPQIPSHLLLPSSLAFPSSNLHPPTLFRLSTLT
jgi:hypothetical protein